MLESKKAWIRAIQSVATGVLSMAWSVQVVQAQPQAPPAAQMQAPSAPTTGRQLGTVQSISANSLALITDARQSITIQMAPDTKLVRLPAGSKDMKEAQPIALNEVAVGDRLLVRGKAGDIAATFLASFVIVMKGDEIEQKHEKEQQDWLKRGTGGLVKSVDPSAKTITISASGKGNVKVTIIKTTDTTLIRRYAPDSVKFEDAQASTLGQIQPNDQLRARGSRNADGDLQAEEIVSGSFRNVAGTVVKIDADSGVLNIKDASTQKPVLLKISADSQLRRLPPQAAQMFARSASGAAPSSPASAPATAEATAGIDHRDVPGGRSTHGAPDLQQVMGRLPKMATSDLKSGDAVMIVATPGMASGEGTVITLLAGVEAILAATPKGAQVMKLAPWDVSGAPAEGAGTP